MSPPRLPSAALPLSPPVHRGPISDTIPEPTTRPFSPLGVYNIRRYLLQHPVSAALWRIMRPSFLASDIAFAAAGASSDGRHAVAPNRFHSQFNDLYADLPTGPVGAQARLEWAAQVKTVLFDIATMLDRSTAGTTFIFHCTGRVPPSESSAVENMKADVYIPPGFFTDHPDADPAIAYLVQTCFEQIGLRACQSWWRRANARWGMFPTIYDVRHPRTPTRLIPYPETAGSAHFKFQGRPVHSLSPPTNLPVVDINNEPRGRSSAFDTPVFDLDEYTYPAAIEDLTSRNEDLEDQLLRMTAERDSLQTRVNALSEEVDQLRAGQAQVQPQTSRPPSTPSRSSRPPTYTESSRYRAIPLPAPMSPSTPSAANAPQSRVPNLMQILTQHGHADKFEMISMVIRLAKEYRWHAEMVRAGIPQAVVDNITFWHAIVEMFRNPTRDKPCFKITRDRVYSRKGEKIFAGGLVFSLDPMPPLGLTIAAASQPRQRAPAPPRAPLTSTQKAERKQERDRKKNAEDADVQAWWTYTFNYAKTLAERHEKTENYYLSIFFQGGANMIKHQEKINPFNAFKAIKAEELREAGGPTQNAPALSESFAEEYNALSSEEKQKFVDDFKEIKVSNASLKRTTPRGRAQDVANIIRNMKLLTLQIAGLCARVGIECMWLIVRNNTDFYMDPQWFFTSPHLERYMPLAVGRQWELSKVGAKVEAFAVAGCDELGASQYSFHHTVFLISPALFRTSKQRCDHLKTQIRTLVNEGLRKHHTILRMRRASYHSSGKVTANPNTTMQYVHYREDIVVGLGVELRGWTAGDIVNPSNLSTSVKVLVELRDALVSGDAHWAKLTREERKERRQEWDDDVVAGKVCPKSRETRSDKGKKRKQGEDEEHDNPDPSSDPASSTAPIVTEPDNPTPPPAKRAKKMGPKKSSAPADKENTPCASTRGKKAGRPRDDATTRQALTRIHAKKSFTSPEIIDDSEDEARLPLAGPTHGSADGAAAVTAPTLAASTMPTSTLI
ncbi:unnamed protein product [Mycena citricolor]|uniref:Uncharacterized protein n=1 Tax=Mycena citricolor TaxID=2018698 RepID=A0AAD2HEU6_9AGAR|nr:unnamed protein product [Mycena citricolor]